MTFQHASIIIMRYLMLWCMMIVPFMFVKKFTGVLRPHFLDICKPNVIECVTGTLVKKFHCTNENLSAKKAQIIMESFPSGHAALAIYFSAVLMFYFHKRLSNRFQSELVIPFIQGHCQFLVPFAARHEFLIMHITQATFYLEH